MRRIALASILVAAFASLALAQALKTIDYSATISTTKVQCVPPDSSRWALWIENPYGNGSATLGYCVDAAGTGCTPSVSPAAGTSVLQAGVGDSWALGNAPIAAVYCIASGSIPVTIRSYRK